MLSIFRLCVGVFLFLWYWTSFVKPILFWLNETHSITQKLFVIHIVLLFPCSYSFRYENETVKKEEKPSKKKKKTNTKRKRNKDHFTQTLT